MKKLLYSVILFAGLFLQNMTFTAYQPATGPLTLGDNHPNRGAIMQIVVDNNPAVVGATPLSAANTVIAQFNGNGQNFSSYQQIIGQLRQTTNNDLANSVVEAFETVIMHMYDYRIYVFGGYRKWQSIVATGIHSPFSYFSSQKTAECKQLIDELDKLAEIVHPHNLATSLRIKTTVESYRHWRRNLALTCAAYLAADACQNGLEKSTAYLLYEKGLSNSPSIVWNGLKNNFAWTKEGFILVAKGLYGTWEYGIKPAGKACLWGAEAFEEKKPDASKSGWFNSSPSYTSLTPTNYLKDTWSSYLETFGKKKLISSNGNARQTITDNNSSSSLYKALPIIGGGALGVPALYYIYTKLRPAAAPGVVPAAQNMGIIVPAGVVGGGVLAQAPQRQPLAHIIPVAPTILQAIQGAQAAQAQAQAAQAQALNAIANPAIGANIAAAQQFLPEIQNTIIRNQTAVASAQTALTLAQAQAAQAEAQATTEVIQAITEFIEVILGRVNPAPVTVAIATQAQAIQQQNQIALQAAQAEAAINQRATGALQRCLYAENTSNRGIQTILANINIPNVMELLEITQALADEAYAAALAAEAA